MRRALCVLVVAVLVCAAVAEYNPCVRPKQSLRRRCRGVGPSANELNAALKPIGRWVKKVKKSIGVSNPYSAAKGAREAGGLLLGRVRSGRREEAACTRGAALAHTHNTRSTSPLCIRVSPFLSLFSVQRRPSRW